MDRERLRGAMLASVSFCTDLLVPSALRCARDVRDDPLDGS